MNSKDFCESLIKTILEQSNSDYRSIIEGSQNDADIKDQFWRDFILFYKSLDKEGKEMLFRVFNQVQIDTISHLLGIIDGTTNLIDVEEDVDFAIKCNNSDFDKDLQETFLSILEDTKK